MKHIIKRFYDVLIQSKVDGQFLAIFRVVFGLAFIKESFRVKESIYPFYIEPETLFHWPFFEWLPLLPENQLNLLAAIMIFSAFMIAVGFFSNAFSLISSLIYAYFFLLDRSYYNNHYYLILLLLILLSFLSSDNKFSIRTLFKSSDGKIPVWNIFILRFQLCLVYFYGATAKLNSDWLSGRTMQASIESEAYTGLKKMFIHHQDFLVLFLTHSGWLFDMVIPFLLLHKRGKYIALPFLIMFHVTNSLYLNIGVFPYLMLGATIIFWGEGLMDKMSGKTTSLTFGFKEKIISISLSLYILFQIFFPMRHFLIEGDYNVTGEGYNFSWKMKGNAIELKRYDIFCFNKFTGFEYKIPIQLHNKQYSTLSSVPLTNIPFAQFIATKVSENFNVSTDSLKVNVFIKIKLNGSEDFYLIDTSSNLLSLEYPSLRHCKPISVNKPKK